MFKSYALLILAALLAGCAGQPRQPDPFKVTIVTIAPLDSTLLEQRYQVTLRIQNRTSQALSIKGMSFDIRLNDREFASGVSNQPVEVAAFDEAVTQVRMSSTLFGWFRQFQALQENRNTTFSYQISGSLHTAGSLFGTSFNESGEFDLSPQGNATRKPEIPTTHQ